MDASKYGHLKIWTPLHTNTNTDTIISINTNTDTNTNTTTIDINTDTNSNKWHVCSGSCTNEFIQCRGMNKLVSHSSSSNAQTKTNIEVEVLQE